MNKTELNNNIHRLSQLEESQKHELERDFIQFKDKMKPANIAKRAIKKGLLKFKSLLPKFSFRTVSGHGMN